MNKNVFLVNKKCSLGEQECSLDDPLGEQNCSLGEQKCSLDDPLGEQNCSLGEQKCSLDEILHATFFYKFICKFQWPIVGNITFALRSFSVFHLFLRNFCFNGYFPFLLGPLFDL